tara:strand:- start:133 stop:339 length:207 start_codon:yes stop_codon:yes gene_type:complete
MNWGYISAFWTTVVMNCVQPVNWQACLPVQDWLFPAMSDLIQLKKEGIYVNEKRALEQFRLDGGRTEP